MPKVTPEHYEKKKQEILEAAKRVCSTKPVYNVAMRDIVIESGMSQGGVYKYFSNLDELFAALLNQESLSHKLKGDVDAIFESDKEPFLRLDEFFQYIGQYIEDSLQGSGKIYFELGALYAKEPERFMMIKDQLEEVSNLRYLQTKLSAFIEEQINIQTFKPVVPAEDIFSFIMTAISGLTHDPGYAYQIPDENRWMPAPGIKRQMNTLSLAILMMLGGDHETLQTRI